MKRVKVSSPPLVNLNGNDDGSKLKLIKKDEVAESQRELGANGATGIGNSKSETSLPVLPEEIWLHIFTLVDNTKDLQNIALSSPTYSKYLQKQKPTFIFKRILPILCHHENGLDKQTLLLLRETCKTWRHSIDTFLECESQRKPFQVRDSNETSHDLTYDPKSLKLKTFTFTNPWNLQKLSDFVREMENDGHNLGNKNPFVGRCLDLEIRPVDLAEAPNHPEIEVAFDLEICLDSFFVRFSHHLWHVKIYDDSGLPLSAMRFYARFCTLMNQLPSIRSLSYTVTHLTPEDAVRRRQLRRGRLELERFMEERPLAAIPVPFLESLEVNLGSHEMNIFEIPEYSDDDENYNSDDNPEDDTDDMDDFMLGPCGFLIQRKILYAYGKQLKKVCMDWGAWIGWQMRIPNVTELRFRNIMSNQDLSSLVQKLTASYAQGSFPKLAKLDLLFEYCRVDVNALMKMLRGLKKNAKLKVVKLSVFGATEMPEGEGEGEESALMARGCAEADFLVEGDDLILEGLEGKIKKWLDVVRN